ncbi:Wiscott-Aldrich syndrome, C-terminal, partial [Zea mays]
MWSGEKKKGGGRRADGRTARAPGGAVRLSSTSRPSVRPCWSSELVRASFACALAPSLRNCGALYVAIFQRGGRGSPCS